MTNFGLTSVVGLFLYIAAIVALLSSIFWRPIVGLYFLVPLIPLQTTRYKLNDLPLGQSVVDIILLGVILGLLIHRQRILPKTPWNVLLCIYAVFTFVSLCYGSSFLRSALPFSLDDPRLADWKNGMIMPLILIVVTATVVEVREMKILVTLMCVAIFLTCKSYWGNVAGHDFSNFSYDLRDNGVMGYAGVNGMAAFLAQSATFILAVAAFERKLLIRLGYISLASFTGMCLMYCLSRGGYFAFLVGLLFLGLAKQRILLVLLIIFLCTWSTLVPGAVQQRVTMTYDTNSGELDHSAAVRVDLWEEASAMIRANPVLGVGFDTYAFTHHVHNYKDSHNYFIKILVETGFVGLILLVCLLARTFQVGCSLFGRAQDPFLSSLGLALAGWVLCASIANFFGDRTYLQVDGYMWVLGGLVARGRLIEQDAKRRSIEENSTLADTGMSRRLLKPELTSVA
jgi:putative inorganic carbon (hco3(-)) transporter